VRLLAEVDRLAAVSLWPNYDPRRYPVAICDGEQTWLFRHPSPPSEFAASPPYSDARIFAGLHPSVRANSFAKLADINTATVMLNDTRRQTIAALGALLIHELFHVFQDQRHPDWQANELDLFVYPMDDAELLQLRRLETEALRRALRAPDRDDQARWAAAALALRRCRFAELPAEAASYERGNELREGLATYVERKAAGNDDPAAILPDNFAANAVRLCGYATGHTLAVLLDHLASSWTEDLERGPTRPLDSLLGAVLARHKVTPASFTSEEWTRELARAQADIGELRASRSVRRDAFLALPGWRLVIIAHRYEPLRPQGFDPMNLHLLGGGEILHTRFLQLSSAAGKLEVLGHLALTEAAGSHPLFEGVQQVTVAGLAEEPVVQIGADRMEITASGVTARFRGGHVEREAQHIRLRLGG